MQFSSYKTLEQFDSNASYVCFIRKIDSLPYQSNSLLKRYKEATRDVIVGR
ncbi:unnamed protein product [Aphanomyces euteiches]